MSKEYPLPRAQSHKLALQVAKYVYNALGELGEYYNLVHPVEASISAAGKPRYAEIARVLLAGEILPNAELPTRVGAAVLCNATLILSGEVAKLTHKLHEDLVQVATKASSAKKAKLVPLKGPKRGEQRTLNENVAAEEKAPIINLTLDGWLYRELQTLADAVVLPDKDKHRSRMAYVINTKLQDALSRHDMPNLVGAYAQAIADVREALENVVGEQLETVRTYLAKNLK